jgi:outer membrane protein TolC
MNRLKRNFIKGICAFALLLASLPALPAYAAQLFPLEQAVDRALKIDPELVDLQRNLRKKREEVNQANQALSNQAIKDFSLFAKQHSLAKDIQLSTKVPEARKEYNFSVRDIRAKELSIRFNMEQLYMKVMQAMDQQAVAEKELDRVRKELAEARTKLKFGLVKKEDIETAEKAVETADSAVKVASLAYKNAKIELGGKVGVNMDNDLFEFSIRRDYVRLSQSLMWRLIREAEKNDVPFYKDVETRKLAEAKVNNIRRMYNNKFGYGATAVIESLYTPQPMDYDKFAENYDVMLGRIKAQWEGIFLIPQPFFPPFILPIPKFILQGEYDGLRYFEDDQYALPIAMLEQDKARAKEKDTREKLAASVKKMYLDTKVAEEAYAQALKAADLAKTETEKAKRSMDSGIMKKDEFDKVAAAQEQAERATQSTFYGYKTAIGSLNLLTGGSLQRYIRGGILPYKEIESGLEALDQEPEQANRQLGDWQLEEVAETMVVDFSIKPDPRLGVSDFELTSEDGKVIGEKTKINGKIRHLGFLFSDPSTLKIVLYKGGDKLAEATLDGYGAQGKLLGPEPPEKEPEDE